MKSLKSFWSRFRLPHAFTLLFFILVTMGILSLILSWAGVTTSDGTTILGAGILDWFTAIPAGIYDAVWIIIFLFALGGFINVVIKSQAMEAAIGKIAQYFHADFKKIPLELKQHSRMKYYGHLALEGLRQTWIIIPLMLFFSFAGTSYGMAEESLAFYAIIIPIALVAGFDVYTGFLIIFVGAGVGVMGSTINPFSVMTAVDSAGIGEVSSSTGAGWRWFSWVLFTLITIVFVMVYAARVKMNRNNSALKDLFEVHSKTFAVAKVGAAAPALTPRRLATVIIFVLSFVIMVFAMLAWDHIQGAPWDGRTTALEYGTFADNHGTSFIHNSTTTQRMFYTASYTNLDKYILWEGQLVPPSSIDYDSLSKTEQIAFDDATRYLESGAIENNSWVGDWTFGYFYLGTLAAYFFIISLIIAAVNWKGERVYIEEMVTGAKDMMGVALAVGIARGIGVLLSATYMQTLFAEKLGGALGGIQDGKGILIPLLSYILFIPLTFIIPSTSGLAGATFPVIGPALEKAGAIDVLPGTITAYAWGAGLANMLVPTYGVVIGALAITKIPYDKFVKAIWKYLLLMFSVGLLMIIIGGATINVDGVIDSSQLF